MNYCEHPEGTAQMLRHMADLVEMKHTDTIKIELVDSNGDNMVDAILSELDGIYHAICCIE